LATYSTNPVLSHIQQATKLVIACKFGRIRAQPTKGSTFIQPTTRETTQSTGEEIYTQYKVLKATRENT
jgi:hypothetical protein